MLYNWCVRINFGRDFLDVFAVEAYTASWIEISIFILDPQTNSVEAYTASWIEMFPLRCRYQSGRVEAYTASWIEILL